MPGALPLHIVAVTLQLTRPHRGITNEPPHRRSGAVILSPENVTQRHMAKLKAAVPGAHVLGYFDVGYIPIKPTDGSCPNCTGHIMGDRPGRNCTTTYSCATTPSAFSAALNAAFLGVWAARDGKTVVAGGVPTERGFYAGQANYIPFRDSAAALSGFLGTWLPAHGFDGVCMHPVSQTHKPSLRLTSPAVRLTCRLKGRPSSLQTLTAMATRRLRTFSTSLLSIGTATGSLRPPHRPRPSTKCGRLSSSPSFDRGSDRRR